MNTYWLYILVFILSNFFLNALILKYTKEILICRWTPSNTYIV